MMTNTIDEREELLSLYSDMHKDAYGFRPREWQWTSVLAMDVVELRRELAILGQDVEAAIKAEAEMEAQAKADLEATIALLMSEQGISKADAYRWLMQAEDCEGDLEHFLWRMGVGCGSLAFAMVKEIKEVLR